MKIISILPIVSLIFGCIVLFPGYAQSQNAPSPKPRGENVQVIELRNYLLKPGKRDSFINAFENKILDTLNGRDNFVLGQYRVKGAEDNFFWIRGFHDMSSRAYALKSFYSCKYWEDVVWIPQAYILNYTNGNLLKPLSLTDGNQDSKPAFPCDWFGKPKGIAVVEFYFAANGWLGKLVEFMRTKYDSIRRASGGENISYWVSEQTKNDYPDLPVYQDNNLLVTIGFYESEEAYENNIKKINASMSEETRNEWLSIVTINTRLVLYPTEMSFNLRQ